MNKPSKTNTLDSELIKLTEAKHHDPFALLGRHGQGRDNIIRVYLPYAETVRINSPKGPEFSRIPGRKKRFVHHKVVCRVYGVG